MNNGLTAMICCGAGVESSRKAIELAARHKNVFATVGVHPEEMNERLDSSLLLRMTRDKKVVAVGECGLDSDNEAEVELFKTNINLAKETGLPLVVHCRNQFEKVYEILKNYELGIRNYGMMHCWTGNEEWMRKFVDMGWYISFGGILTFKNSHDLRTVAANVPEDRLLIETDSPYLAPEPKRGTKNIPENVRLVAGVLARTRNVPIGRIEEVTTRNAMELFKLDSRSSRE